MLTVHSLATGTIARHVPDVDPVGISQVEPAAQNRPQHGCPAAPHAGRASATSPELIEPESLAPLSMRTPVSVIDESMDELDPSELIEPLSELIIIELSELTPVSITPESVSVDESMDALPSEGLLESAPPSVVETHRARVPLVSQRSLAAQPGLQLETHAPATQVNPSRQLGTHAVGGGGLHATNAEEPKSNAKDQERIDWRIIAVDDHRLCHRRQLRGWRCRGILAMDCMEELDPIARARRTARTAALGGLLAASFPWMLAQEQLVPNDKRSALRGRHIRRFMRRCLDIFSVHVTIEGSALARDGARLIVSNHRSGFDIPILGSLFDGSFLSRADLSTWPAIGPAARHIGTLFVDRKDQNSRAGAVKAMRRVLKADESVLVFPEGTTYPGDDVRPFHPGAFVAAKDLSVKVLSVGFAYEERAQYVEKSFGAHLAKVAALPSVKCALVLGETRPIGPVREETERTRQEVIALVKRARALLG